MSEWQQTTLGKFVSLQRGHDLPSSQRIPGKIPVIGSGGPNGWHNEAKAKGPGITIGRAANLGVPQFIEADFWPLNTTLYVTSFNGNDIRFVYNLFKAIDLTGFNSGSVQPMLNRNYIQDFKILVPPAKEQEAIATALGALDDKIAVNEHILALYEAILQTQFDHLIATDQYDHTSEVSVTKLVDFNPKTAKPTEEEAVYVDMAALPTDRAPISTWTHRKPKSGSRFLNSDTLMARITPCLENGKTGYVDFMDDGQIGTGSTEFIVMRSRPEVPQEFSYFLARNKRFRNHAIQKMTGTSGRQRVSAADASNFFIRQPTEEELRFFGSETSKAFAHMKSLTTEFRALAELRDTLLPQLMSGKLRVKDAEKLVEDAT